MQINKIYFNNFNQYKNNVQNTNENIIFRGLTSDFERKVYPRHKNLEALYNIRKSDIVGTLPQDITKKIVENSSSKQETENNVKNILKSFQEAVITLREGEVLLKQSLNEIINYDFINQANEYLKQDGIYEYVDFLNKTFSYNSLDKNELVKFQNKAQLIIKQALIQAKVLKDDDEVHVDYISSGAFGHVFNISFLDKDSDKIIHNKTLKIYRDRQLEQQIQQTVDKKEQEMRFSKTFEDYLTIKYAELLKSLPKDFVITEDFFDRFRDEKLSEYNQMKDNSDDDFEFEYVDEYACDFEDECIDEHGCFAEANRALFIKNRIGDTRNSNFIEPFFFDLKNRFGLFETADSELTEVKKQIDLKTFNLKHNDIENPDNTINGRLIDYGGISNLT